MTGSHSLHSRATLIFEILLVACIASGLAATARAVESNGRLDDRDRGELVDLLQETLHESRGWVRIHAAEALLWHGYTEEVAAAFSGEVESDSGEAESQEPGRRIGVWRVLARAAEGPQERRAYVEQIRRALHDPDGPDRVHAAEALAQLGAALTPKGRQAAEQLSASADLAIAAFPLWLLHQGGEVTARPRLLELLLADDPIARRRAAEALRHLKPSLTSAERDAIVKAATSEPDDSPAKVSLLGTAWLIMPPGAEPSGSGVSREALGDVLRARTVAGSADDRVAAVMTLAEGGTSVSPDGTKGDVRRLRELLDDGDPEVRLAAAHALLRIDRRVPHRMVALDWIVISVYMLGMLLVGWYYSRRVTTTDDYLLGGRTMKPWAVGLSLFATLLSTITYLSWPGEIIKHGPMMLCSLMAYPFVAWVVGWALIPYFMKLNVTSAYEILEARLGLSVRLLGSVFFLSLRLLWMAVIIYATISTVLVPLMGLDPSATPWLCALLGAITVIYTSLGGLRAVVFTDVIQTTILFGGAILAVIVISTEMGGVSAWWPTEWSPNWQEPKFGYDPNARVTLVGAFVAAFTWFTCTAGSDQMAIQRYLSTRDVRSARRMFNISLVTSVSVQLFLALLGFALLGYFRAHRYILSDGQTISSHADQLFPQFIVVGLPAGISGLVVAGLLAAAMSSLSSGLNSSCSVVTVDFIDRFRKTRDAELDHVRLARYISVVIGVIVVVLSSFVGAVHGNMLEIAYKVTNLLVVPLFGLFFMAMFVRWATPLGTIVGAVAGLTVVSAINYWKEITGTEGISFLWAMPLSFLAQIGLGAIVSLLPIGRRPEIKPEDLIAD